MVGVLFLGVIQTGLMMLNFETYVINLVQGGILIAAVLVSRLGQRSLTMTGPARRDRPQPFLVIAAWSSAIPACSRSTTPT